MLIYNTNNTIFCIDVGYCFANKEILIKIQSTRLSLCM